MSNEPKAWGQCYACSGTVAVKANKSGLAYYRCDHCGIEMRHHWHKSSDKMLQGLGAASNHETETPPPAPPRRQSLGEQLGL